jgi:addiction module HigA family antidote
MEPFGLSSRKIAKNLNVAPSTINRLLKGENNVSPEMALRLARVFGRSPESWLAMQDHFSLWQAKQIMDFKEIKKLELIAV